MTVPTEDAVLTAEDVTERIGRLPRAHLANLPTPLDDCPRLTSALGGPRILMKRDDLTGLAFGGNKTRKLEFNFGEVLAQGADVVVGSAAAQSNHCRQGAAAAAKLGIDAVLILQGGRKDEVQGNLLLDTLLGAEVHLVPPAEHQHIPAMVEGKIAELQAAGRRPYQLMGTPHADRLGALAYVACFAELWQQAAAQGISLSRLYVASGGGTQAGLVLGARLIAPHVQVVGLTPSETSAIRRPRVAALANAAAEVLQVDLRLSADDITNLDDYVGPAYGQLTEGCVEALRLVAQTEGIILDPVYTGKAMAGLVDHVRRGRIPTSETIVFVHTGGTPALFAYADDLGAYPPGAALG